MTRPILIANCQNQKNETLFELLHRLFHAASSAQAARTSAQMHSEDSATRFFVFPAKAGIRFCHRHRLEPVLGPTEVGPVGWCDNTFDFGIRPSSPDESYVWVGALGSDCSGVGIYA
jgi:hypothetical protein